MKFVPKPVSRLVGKAALRGVKHAPQILFGTGVVGVVGTAVMASRATLKLDHILDEAEATMLDAKTLIASGNKKYTQADYDRDMRYIYIKTAVTICKLYAPTLIVGGLTVGALSGAHNILNKRNAALTIAYTALEKSYSEYQARVSNELGYERERNLRHGLHEVKNPETKQKELVKKKGEESISQYARFFDEGSPNWNPKSGQLNHMFLQAQEKYANDRLASRGYLFLNEVYASLGLKQSPEGQLVGWVYDGDGDNFVDFGISAETNPRARDLVNGWTDCILLDFNVDGVIYDLI